MEGATTGMATIFSQIAQFFGADGPIPTVWGWLTGADVLPFFGLGIAVSLILFGVKMVRGAIWGV